MRNLIILIFTTLVALLFLAQNFEPGKAAAATPAPAERITSVVELTAVPVQWRSFTDPTQQVVAI
jgi:hypothetical protein